MQQRALVVDDGVVRLNRRIALDAPGKMEVLVRPTYASIGSLEVAVGAGRIPHSGPMGSEFVGTVEEVGASADALLVGQRVVASMVGACGQCDLCRGGLGAHCRDRAILGMHGQAGGLADAVVVPAPSVHKVPDTVDDDHALFANTVASALQAVRQLTIENKPYVTVLGDGPVGLIVAQLMSRLNASVRVLGRHAEKLALGEKWGVQHRHIDDVGRRADQDIVVDCTGTSNGLAVAMRLVRPRGTILCKTLGHTAEARATDLSPIVLRELTIIGSFAGSVADALTTLMRREVDILSLITRRVTLDDAEAGYRLAAEPGSMKVVVEVG